MTPEGYDDMNALAAFTETATGDGYPMHADDPTPGPRRRSAIGRRLAALAVIGMTLSLGGPARAWEGEYSGAPIVVGDGPMEPEAVPPWASAESGAVAPTVDIAPWMEQVNEAPAMPAPMVRQPAFVPRWDLTVDALMLWQGNAQSLPLFLDSAGGVALNAQDMQTQMGAGARVGLIRYVGESHAIEGNYFQARPFNATGQAPAEGGPYELTNTGDLAFNDIASATVSSNGWIQSAEVNWRICRCYSPITWLAGFRWVELNSQTNVDYAFENPDPFGSGSINTGVGNNLYGAQLGADMRLFNAGGKWRLNGLGKAGVFYNAASYQRSTAGFVTAAGDDFPLGTVAATADQTAFFGEVGLTSTYWITRWLAWRAGYTVLWASGVAVAAEQLPLNSFGDGTATINTESSVLLHGVTTGIEARW